MEAQAQPTATRSQGRNNGLHLLDIFTRSLLPRHVGRRPHPESEKKAERWGGPAPTRGRAEKKEVITAKINVIKFISKGKHCFEAKTNCVQPLGDFQVSVTILVITLKKSLPMSAPSNVVPVIA